MEEENEEGRREERRQGRRRKKEKEEKEEEERNVKRSFLHVRVFFIGDNFVASNFFFFSVRAP